MQWAVVSRRVSLASSAVAGVSRQVVRSAFRISVIPAKAESSAAAAGAVVSRQVVRALFAGRGVAPGGARCVPLRVFGPRLRARATRKIRPAAYAP
jgi:hypothetical protein